MLSFCDFVKVFENTAARWLGVESKVKGKNSMVVCLPEGVSVYLRKD